MSLELALRLQPPGTDRPIGVEHETVVPQLARRAACFTRCCVRLQQFELTAVVYDAHRQRTFLAAPSRGPFAVQGAEAGVVELAFRRMQIGAVPPRRGHAPTERAARSFGTRRTAQLEVVRRARERESRAHEGAPTIRRERQRLRNHIHDAANRVGSIEYARRTANDLDSTHKSRFDRWSVFIAPRVILQSTTVLQHDDARSRQPANHRFADLRAGTQRAETGKRLENMGERHALLATQAFATERRDR